MNEASFSNREIAGLVVLGLLVMCVALVLRRRDGEARAAGRGLISSFLHWKILVPVLGFVFWVLAMLLLAARLGIWNASLWKATLLWLLLSGFGLFGKFPDAIDQPKFVRRTIAHTLGVFLVIEFAANFASFALWIEIPVQMLAFVFGIVAVAAREPEHARIAKLANGYLALLGAYALSWGVWRLTSEWSDIDRWALAREFSVPIWMTPVALVYVYALGIFAAYESLFVRMRAEAKEQPLIKQRLAVCIRTRGRLSYLRALDCFGPASWIARTDGFKGAWNELGDIRRRDRERVAAEKAAQLRLVENAGIVGVDSSGKQLDQREHPETMAALRDLASCQMGHHRNRGNRYSESLASVAENMSDKHGLPAQNGIRMYVDAKGERWYAERQTITGHWFAIGASAPPSDQWLHDGPVPPSDYPNETEWDQWAPDQHAINWD